MTKYIFFIMPFLFLTTSNLYPNTEKSKADTMREKLATLSLSQFEEQKEQWEEVLTIFSLTPNSATTNILKEIRKHQLYPTQSKFRLLTALSLILTIGIAPCIFFSNRDNPQLIHLLKKIVISLSTLGLTSWSIGHYYENSDPFLHNQFIHFLEEWPKHRLRFPLEIRDDLDAFTHIDITKPHAQEFAAVYNEIIRFVIRKKYDATLKATNQLLAENNGEKWEEFISNLQKKKLKEFDKSIEYENDELLIHYTVDTTNIQLQISLLSLLALVIIKSFLNMIASDLQGNTALLNLHMIPYLGAAGVIGLVLGKTIVDLIELCQKNPCIALDKKGIKRNFPVRQEYAKWKHVDTVTIDDIFDPTLFSDHISTQDGEIFLEDENLKDLVFCSTINLPCNAAELKTIIEYYRYQNSLASQ